MIINKSNESPSLDREVTQKGPQTSLYIKENRLDG